MNSDEIDELIAAARAGHCGENQGCNTRPTCGCAAIDDLTDALRQLQADNTRLVAENESLRKGLGAVADLINESEGVTGLHLNGDIAPWDELREGGRFEDWLVDFDAALERQNEAKEGTSAQLQQEQERNDDGRTAR